MSRKNDRASAALLDDAAPVFAALGDATRLSLVARLCTQGPLSITRLHDGNAVTRQAITKHLEVLSDAGLVRGTRHGRERIWEIEKARLQRAQLCLQQISQQWDGALERLKTLVER